MKRLNRRTGIILLIIAGVIVLSAGAGITYLYLGPHRSAIESLRHTRTEVTGATTQANAAFTATDTTKAAKVTAVADYRLALQTILDEVCVGYDDQWYSWTLPAKTRCANAQRSLEKVIEQVAILKDFLESEQQLAALIQVDTTGLSYQATYDKWQAAAVAIGEVSVPTQLEPTKTVLQNAVTAYAAAWKLVVDADAAKDKTAFQATQVGVETNFQALKLAGADVSTQLDEVLQTLTTAYNDLLKTLAE